MNPVLQVCPACQAPVSAGELFCEGCGADLAAAGSGAGTGIAVPVPGGASAPTEGTGSGSGSGAPSPGDPAAAGGSAVLVDAPDLTAQASLCPSCGSSEAPDGYCGHCGTPVPLPRDHWREQPAPWVAAVCDRGIRHPHNEDAVAVAATTAADGFAALVVCDGVSSSRGSDVASLAAVRAALDVLTGRVSRPTAPALPVPAPVSAPGLPVPAPAVPPGSAAVEGAAAGNAAVAGGPGSADPGPGSGSPKPGTISGASRAGQLAELLVRSGIAANDAVVATAGDPPAANPPSCTFVAAVVEDGLLVAGWAGDSRAYWLPDDGLPEQVSADDSWAGEAVAAGIPREDAERAPHAHAITRWLGVDAPDPAPRTAARALDRAGWVLVCSDGLWNYCSAAPDLRELVADTVRLAGPDPARLASALVDWAKQQGGHDNITVALARVTPAPAAG
ncbi:MAG TPA: PP2C family serine/threonine-protein phosphatase [Kineosporiaceae bacterium]|nr:PP2C family serine/threonine-protein phosphatase [Kineosporiaceae bacterium]